MPSTTSEPSGSASGAPMGRTPARAAGTAMASAAAMAVPESGSGRTRVLAVPGRDSARGDRAVRYTVEVEDGLGVSAQEYAVTVRRVLTAARGWQTRDKVRFVQVSPERRAAGAAVDVRIILASPAFVDRNCLPMRTAGRLSCHAGTKVLLNARRWMGGADAYGADLAGYRTYLISHEVGHALGHGHAACPGAGRPAPVMMQQTKGVGGCRPWPWPVPPS